MIFTEVNRGFCELYWAKCWCFGFLQELNLFILEGALGKSACLGGF